MDEITRETHVKASELAAVLGLTGRRVHQLVEDGIIVKAARGRFCLADCVQRYIEYRTDSALDDEAQQIDLEKRRADSELRQSKAKIARLEAAELEGKMHRSEDVAALTEDLVYTIRGTLIALPGRVAVDVAAVNTAAEASTIVRREVYAIMRELSQYRYDPRRYEEKVRGRLNWDNIAESNDS